VLAGNNLAELADLDVLAGFGRLTHLVLADNPVTKKEVSGECCQKAEVKTADAVWLTTGRIALPVLGSLEVSISPVPRLREGQGCGEAKRTRAVRHSRGAHGARDNGTYMTQATL
jgi:hypothetical protein